MTDRLRVWEFKDAELDLLVAQASGIHDPRIIDGVCMIPGPRSADTRAHPSRVPFRPSTSWTEGGPILDQANISLFRYPDNDSWHACTDFDFVRSEGLKGKCYMQGPTPLVAAMRCFAALKLWKDVQEGPPE